MRNGVGELMGVEHHGDIRAGVPESELSR
ncbi:MAG: hypothetical protein QOF70_1700, partial [Acetobacteraceae bacterium]|nr:hypothetical protein [Acetobacteraceae bacterium]